MSASPHLNSYMETQVVPGWQCVCPSYPAYGPTPWLECVHASVYEFLSI